MRFIAFLFLILPAAIATYGIKLMRDSFFGELTPIFMHIIAQFVVGLAIFIGGLYFIGGFIVHRDRKRKLTKGEKNNRFS